MSLYEFFKDKYNTVRYPIIDERQFDELVAEIRAESSERIKRLEEGLREWKAQCLALKYPCEEKECEK